MSWRDVVSDCPEGQSRPEEFGVMHYLRTLTVNSGGNLYEFLFSNLSWSMLTRTL